MSDREPTASLDDLLRHEEEMPRTERTETIGLWLGKYTLVSALFAGMIWGFGRLAGIGLSYLALTAGLLALFGLRRVVREVTPPESMASMRSSIADYNEAHLQWPTVDGLYAASAPWDNRLTWTQRDAERFEAQVRPMLGDLVDERLRQRHGLTRRSDPARAQALLGDPLWTFLTTPVTRSPTPKQVAAVIQRMEEL